MGRVQRRGERKGINKGVQGTWASEGRRSRPGEKRAYHVSQCWSELEVTRSGAATLALAGKRVLPCESACMQEYAPQHRAQRGVVSPPPSR